MKTMPHARPCCFVVASALLAYAAPVQAQTLGSTAATYDLFVLNGPGLNNNTTFMDADNKTFNGMMGLGRNSLVSTEPSLNFGGEVRRHSILYNHSWRANGLSGSIVNAQGTHDAELDLANSQILTFYNDLNALSATQSFGNRSTSFTYNTSSALTVLDFGSITMNGSGDVFTLNGRAGQDDMVVIRASNDVIFDSGAPMFSTNLDPRNIIWIVKNDSNFNLHKNNGANFEGVIINPAVTGNNSTIIGNVDFKGQVYASELRVGSGGIFTGSSIVSPIPEPSSSLLLIAGAGALLTIRRRKK